MVSRRSTQPQSAQSAIAQESRLAFRIDVTAIPDRGKRVAAADCWLLSLASAAKRWRSIVIAKTARQTGCFVAKGLAITACTGELEYSQSRVTDPLCSDILAPCCSNGRSQRQLEELSGVCDAQRL